MMNNLGAVKTNLFRFTEQFYQSKRTTYIIKRLRQVRLSGLCQIFPKKLKRRDFYYKLVEDTDSKARPPVEIVLTANVPGVGMRGEKLLMNPYIAYRDLLLPKLAVYLNSPEAKKIVKTTEEKQYSSKYTRIVQNYLASQAVKVILSNDIQWTLKPWHVKFAIRKNGIILNEDCIKIPKEISGPNFDVENKDFVVYLTMNKSEVFPVRCRIYQWSTTDPSLNQKSFDVDSFSEPLFPDEKEIIDSLIKVQQDIRKSKMVKGEGEENQKKKRR